MARSRSSREGYRQRLEKDRLQGRLPFDGPAPAGPPPRNDSAAAPAVSGPASAKPWVEAPEDADPAAPTRQSCAPGSLAWEWLDFHDAHPEVLAAFVAECELIVRAAESQGRRPRVGAKKVWETLRDKFAAVGLRLNNNHTAFCARAAVERSPALRGVIQFRRQRDAD